MRTKLLKASVVVALLAILVGMPLLITPHRIRQTSFARLRVGMSEAEIEEVLGAKAGNYDGYHPTMSRLADMTGVKSWCGREVAIVVTFNPQGNATFLLCLQSEPATWWGKLCHRVLPTPAAAFAIEFDRVR